MTDETKQEALTVLAQIWELTPDVRLGQLMAHLGFLGEVHVGRGLGYIEDDELLAVMYRHRAELLARGSGVEQPTQEPDGETSVSGSPTWKTVLRAADS